MTEYCLLSFWRFTRPANYRAAFPRSFYKRFYWKRAGKVKKDCECWCTLQSRSNAGRSIRFETPSMTRVDSSSQAIHSSGIKKRWWNEKESNERRDFGFLNLRSTWETLVPSFLLSVVSQRVNIVLKVLLRLIYGIIRPLKIIKKYARSFLFAGRTVRLRPIFFFL